MKKTLIIFIALFCLVGVVLAEEDTSPYIAGSTVAAGEKSYILGPITFESATYTTGEIDGQDSWAEVTASANYHLITNSQAEAGTQSYMQDCAASATRSVEKALTSAQSSKFTIEFDLRVAVAENSARFGVAVTNSETSANQSICLRIDENDIFGLVDGSWVAVTATDLISVDTWYHFEIEVDPTADTYEIWVDETSKGTHDCRYADINPDRFYGMANCDAGSDVFIDNLEAYSGVRQ